MAEQEEENVNEESRKRNIFKRQYVENISNIVNNFIHFTGDRKMLYTICL